MPEQTTICQQKPSTFYTYDNPQVQNAAASVYTYTSTFNAAQEAKGSKAKYQFKTDLERMQYLIGLYGQTSRGLA